MDDLRLYRKRLIPNECIELKNDHILYMDPHVLITSWQTLKPRNDFHHGYSCYFLDFGYKVSRFYRADHSLLYTYCDIVSYSSPMELPVLTVTDLLADVIIYPDHTVQVIDIDELCDAHDQSLISDEAFFTAVRCLGSLLKDIQSKNLSKQLELLDSYIKKSED